MHYSMMDNHGDNGQASGLKRKRCTKSVNSINEGGNPKIVRKVKTVEIGVQTEPERCCSKAVQVTPVAAVSLLCIRCQASVLPISPVDLTNDENEDNNVFEVSDMPSVFPPFLQTFSVQRPDALPSTPTLIECPAAEQLASLPTSSLLSSLPPVPTLRGEQTEESVTLSWNILQDPSQYELISKFQLCCYQELGSAPFSSDLLKMFLEVKPRQLPMKCSLNKMKKVGGTFFFAVRAVDHHQRYGGYSSPFAVCCS